MEQQTIKTKVYDLEERTFLFAERINKYINNLPKSITNTENARQLCRSAGSVAANYIEANESLGKKDFLMRIKISRKEAKESILWLRLSQPKQDLEDEKKYLIQESTELMKIFGAILIKSTAKS